MAALVDVVAAEVATGACVVELLRVSVVEGVRAVVVDAFEPPHAARVMAERAMVVASGRSFILPPSMAHPSFDGRSRRADRSGRLSPCHLFLTYVMTQCHSV